MFGCDFTESTVNIFETNKYVFVLLISTMICFCSLFFDGRNDRCWMVLPFWDTFNIVR